MSAVDDPTARDGSTGPQAGAPAPGDGPAPVALVHHWLVSRRGGEKCLDALASLLPGAPVYTLVHDPDACPPPAAAGPVIPSSLQRWPGGVRRFRALAPWFHRFYRGLDVSAHPFVVSSDASLAKAVRKGPGARHVCYCYSPVRWAFDLREDYLDVAVLPPLRGLARRVLDRVAAADRRAASDVDAFLTISRHVAARIERAYDREAPVVSPPVDTGFFTPGEPEPLPDGIRAPWSADERPYLLLGQAVPYKRFDVAVNACRALRRPLVVAGGGPDWEFLRKLASPLTVFIPRPDDATVRSLYRGARALLFPGEEDFGIVPVEAMASGCPVIALGVGGATETVVPGRTGVFAEAVGDAAFQDAIRQFEAIESGFAPTAMVERAAGFSLESHLRSMRAALTAAGVPVD